MFDYEPQALARYIRTLMADHGFRSERAFALHTGVSPRTLGRILDGTKVDPESLLRIAQALNLPVENLYRLAGYLPPEEDRSRLLREVEYLLRDLSEADQRRILEQVRIEHRYRQSPQEEQSEADQVEKTG